jgi:hypothetical protein
MNMQSGSASSPLLLQNSLSIILIELSEDVLFWETQINIQHISCVDAEFSRTKVVSPKLL